MFQEFLTPFLSQIEPTMIANLLGVSMHMISLLSNFIEYLQIENVTAEHFAKLRSIYENSSSKNVVSFMEAAGSTGDATIAYLFG